jgi:hypothetical protein
MTMIRNLLSHVVGQLLQQIQQTFLVIDVEATETQHIKVAVKQLGINHHNITKVEPSISCTNLNHI